MTRSEWPEQISLLIAQRIRQLRQEAGISQQTLGDALNVSFQQIQKYETGANRISVNRLLQIAKALNVDIRSLFDGIVTGSKSPQFPSIVPAKRVGRAGGMSGYGTSTRKTRLKAGRFGYSRAKQREDV